MPVRSATQALQVLLAPGERWGWVRHDYSPLFEPYRVPPPQFVAPPPPAPPALSASPTPKQDRWKILGIRLPVVILVGFLGPLIVVAVLESGKKLTAHQKDRYTSIGSTIWVLVLALIVVTLLVRFARPHLARAGTKREYQRSVRDHGSEYARAEAEYQVAVQRWQAAGEEYRAGQARQQAGLPVRAAAQLHSRPRRVDIYGDPSGWSALLATVGASALGCGQDLLVLDVSRTEAAVSLLGVVESSGASGFVASLPADAAEFDLLAGLDRDQIKDVLVEAFCSTTERRQRDERLLADRTLGELMDSLADPVTLPRLWRGLRVAFGMDVAPSAGPELTAGEALKLSGLFSEDYRVRMGERLLGVEAQLHALRGFGTKPAGRRPTYDFECYSLARNAKGLEGEILHDFLLQRVIQRAESGDSGRPLVIMVIGADRLEPRHLSRLDEQTVRTRSRLVYCYASLSADAFERAGSGGAVGFLRLDGATDAERAATWIGSEYKLVLSELSERSGTNRSVAEGWSRSVTETLGVTRQWGRSTGGMPSENFSMTITPPSETTGDSRTVTTGESSDQGRSMSRVYEKVVEPDVMRSLPRNSCVLVEFAGGRRRVVTAELNPELAYDPGTSSDPLPPDLLVKLGTP